MAPPSESPPPRDSVISSPATWSQARELGLVALLLVTLVVLGLHSVLREIVPSNEHAFLEAMGVVRPSVGALAFVFTLPFVLFQKEGVVVAAGVASLAGAALLFGTLFFVATRIAKGRVRTYWDEIAALVACLTFALTTSMFDSATLPGARPLLVLLALGPFFVSVFSPRSDVFLAAAAGLALTASPLVGMVALVTALVVRRGLPNLRVALPVFLVALAIGIVPWFVLHDRRAFTSTVELPPLGARLASLMHEIGPVVLLFVVLGLAVDAGMRFRSKKGFDEEARLLALTLGLALVLFFVPLLTKAEGTIATLAVFALLPLLFARALVFVFRRLADTSLPYARTSAGFLVLLTLAVPLGSAETMLRVQSARRVALDDSLTTFAYAEIPKGALVFLSNERIHEHLLAARIAGALPKDAELIRIDGGLPRDLLLPDETLREVMRDLVFEGRLRELALTKLSETRPVFVVFDGSYDRAVARHLSPNGWLDRFSTEPRAPSDRKVELARWKLEHDLLVSELKNPLAQKEYTQVFEPVLEARMTALRLVSDRETLFTTAQDLAAVNPENELAKMVIEKGDPAPVREVRPTNARVTATR